MKVNLDKRICDVIKGASNTETYREFIKTCENEFGMPHKNLDEMEEVDIEEYLDLLDDLWGK